MKKMILLLAVVGMLGSCQSGAGDHTTLSDTATIEGHPAWIIQGNIYEVNVRQYTPEGTFKAFAKHLDRLKEMGVQTLWFMPIYPIGKVDRKGTLGSYYAISNYTTINPEFGSLQDWDELVQQCHEKGFKVIVDWVANHTSADHGWLTSHPDFYVQDSITHKALSPFDWTDARKLNYKNPVLRDSMVASMEYWLNHSKIDGFRCDVATEVPEDFWTKCIGTLRTGRNIFMLAEGDMAWLHKAGFDASYTWYDFSVMKEIAKGAKPATFLDTPMYKTDTGFAKNALRLYFTSNHDENSWNKADYGTMPGESHAPFAVLTQTLRRSVPLIYSGQEEPFLDSISFFYKDTIHFEKYARAGFYSKLLSLRKSNEALQSLAAQTKVTTNAPEKVYAFVRSQNGKKVLVVVNLSKDAEKATLTNASIAGEATELFSNAKESVKDGQVLDLKPWDYKVYVY